MSASSLMARAREIVQSRAGAAAIVIVPLAIAVPGRAGSVAFTYDANSSFVTGNTGGAFGTVEGDPNSDDTAITLTGTSKPEKPLFPSLTYLSKGQVESPLAPIGFNWIGGFGPNSVAYQGGPLDISYNLAFQGTPHDSSDSVGTVNWTLEIFASQGGSNLLEISSASGSALLVGLSDSVIGTLDPSFSSGAPSDAWKAVLTVNWNFASSDLSSDASFDQLSIIPMITLSAPGSGALRGSSAVPLPAGFWLGSELISILGLVYSGKRRSRRMRASAR